MTAATEINAALPKAARSVARIEALDWQEISKNLDELGNATLAGVLTLQECQALASLYPNEEGFRSRVVMERHGFGRGEYKYFSYPLPGGCDATAVRSLSGDTRPRRMARKSVRRRWRKRWLA